VDRRAGLGVGAGVVVAVVGLIAWFVVGEDGGDRQAFDVVAEVADECQSLEVRVDGLHFTANEGIPPAWRGTDVDGRLDITDDSGSTTSATFTGSDGETATLEGGPEGEYFAELSCATW
jgi:hypothetical protein